MKLSTKQNRAAKVAALTDALQRGDTSALSRIGNQIRKPWAILIEGVRLVPAGRDAAGLPKSPNDPVVQVKTTLCYLDRPSEVTRHPDTTVEGYARLSEDILNGHDGPRITQLRTKLAAAV